MRGPWSTSETNFSIICKKGRKIKLENAVRKSWNYAQTTPSWVVKSRWFHCSCLCLKHVSKGVLLEPRTAKTPITAREGEGIKLLPYKVFPPREQEVSSAKLNLEYSTFGPRILSVCKRRKLHTDDLLHQRLPKRKKLRVKCVSWEYCLPEMRNPLGHKTETEHSETLSWACLQGLLC